VTTKNILEEIDITELNGYITRRCMACGKPIVRFKILRDSEKSCTFVDLELKSKCGENSKIRIRV
jgi:hypothetical protein